VGLRAPVAARRGGALPAEGEGSEDASRWARVPTSRAFRSLQLARHEAHVGVGPEQLPRTPLSQGVQGCCRSNRRKTRWNFKVDGLGLRCRGTMGRTSVERLLAAQLAAHGSGPVPELRDGTPVARSGRHLDTSLWGGWGRRGFHGARAFPVRLRFAATGRVDPQALNNFRALINKLPMPCKGLCNDA